ncbi:Na+/H+ antiporter subunit G [Limimaricola pyoseonensis]|uniref:Multisubunit potassium/proton antiporter, PhaG subunit n=1 Tax=Limimaricola pyoseonensis TaxID=521013 RepID=A0A1G7FTS9_9RHOB|nr:Na+/H+ antiporter subunit G [Limimaricola pyoseonensis]SDE79261.1 multisubunit potassium/proton antiporter, PhaG subunit [Limimaricola pyoseonensis]
MLIEILIALVILNGAVFTLVGSYGLLKLTGPMSRLHAPTKASTLGVGSLLLGSILHAFASGEGSMHEVLVMAFLFVTAPISANFIAKVNLHRLRGRPELPPPPESRDWATYAEK